MARKKVYTMASIKHVNGHSDLIITKSEHNNMMQEIDSDLRKKHSKNVFDDGDPNNPKYNNGYNYATESYTLFGYDQEEFMAKQYR